MVDREDLMVVNLYVLIVRSSEAVLGDAVLEEALLVERIFAVECALGILSVDAENLLA